LKCCHVIGCSKQDGIALEQAITELLDAAYSVPRCFAAKAHTLQAQQYAAHQNLDDFIASLRVDRPSALLARLDSSSRLLLNRDIVEKSFAKYAPARGCQRLKETEYKERLLKYAEAVLGAPILAAADNTDWTLVVTVFGTGAQNEQERQLALETLLALPDTSSVKGLTISQLFKLCQVQVEQAAPAAGAGVANIKKRFGMLQAKFQRLNELEMEADPSHKDIMDVGAQIKLLWSSVHNRVCELGPAHSQQASFETLVHALMQYQENTHAQVDLNAANTLSRLGKARNSADSQWHLDGAAESVQHNKELVLRAQQVAPNAGGVGTHAGSPWTTKLAIAQDWYDSIVRVAEGAQLALTFAQLYSEKVNADAGSEGEEGLTAGSFHLCSLAHSAMQRQFHEHEANVDSAYCIRWKAESTYFDACYSLKAQGVAMYARTLACARDAFARVIELQLASIPTEDWDTLSQHNLDGLARLSAFSSTPIHDMEAIRVVRACVDVTRFRAEHEAVLDRGDAKTAVEYEALGCTCSALLAMEKSTEEQTRLSLIWALEDGREEELIEHAREHFRVHSKLGSQALEQFKRQAVASLAKPLQQLQAKLSSKSGEHAAFKAEFDAEACRPKYNALSIAVQAVRARFAKVHEDVGHPKLCEAEEHCIQGRFQINLSSMLKLLDRPGLEQPRGEKARKVLRAMYEQCLNPDFKIRSLFPDALLQRVQEVTAAEADDKTGRGAAPSAVEAVDGGTPSADVAAEPTAAAQPVLPPSIALAGPKAGTAPAASTPADKVLAAIAKSTVERPFPSAKNASTEAASAPAVKVRAPVETAAPAATASAPATKVLAPVAKSSKKVLAPVAKSAIRKRPLSPEGARRSRRVQGLLAVLPKADDESAGAGAGANDETYDW
jgi:hypothetical protein